MHAINRNLVTCAWMGCHQPGTHPVAYRAPNVEFQLADGHTRTREGRLTLIEYCQLHAGYVDELRCEQAAPVPVKWIGART